MKVIVFCWTILCLLVSFFALLIIFLFLFFALLINIATVQHCNFVLTDFTLEVDNVLIGYLGIFFPSHHFLYLFIYLFISLYLKQHAYLFYLFSSHSLVWNYLEIMFSCHDLCWAGEGQYHYVKVFLAVGICVGDATVMEWI